MTPGALERVSPALEPSPAGGARVHALHRVPTGPDRERPSTKTVASAFRGFLQSLGLDPADANLAGTDRRVARAYREMLSGLRRPAPKLSTFPNSNQYAEMVSVGEIPFYSICAHHFLPFFGTARVAYVPKDRLIGLSKLSRAVDYYARRPQLQEDLTEQIASLLEERLAPAGLIVCIEARHLCMEMRGVSKPGLITKTVAARGTLRDDRLQRRFFEREARS